MKILGIETSADDTGIALIEAEGKFGPDFSYKVLGNAISSQAIHSQYGGIFPALAKREHAKNLPAVLDQVLGDANEPVPHPNIDAIAVTHGPGLEPCLWTGITFAQELSKKWNVPVVPVNHMEGHILISVMEKGKLAQFDFPALALLVSGGHTELILMKSFGQYEYIGRTRDDAVGEAFDKVARLLELPYPGGPEISRLAAYARSEKLPALLKLPRPMMTSDDYDFSFSGLKTAVERYVQAHELQSLDREKLACEFEDAVTDVLVYKTLRAVEEYGVNAVVMGGGVSANKYIRVRLAEALAKVGARLLVCPPEFSTDNGLMIALAGYFHALKKEFADPENLAANGNLKLC
ncbi:tRNA (adenosine(37)-N6)-threonylcarbamoyltransferase complex transferase subunit TsaD [Candidatus Kaiserbacteria bacterium RIFCSPLOWO2_01_FULL_54_20]|uniref:tRNA N6-adenosine threonylcarbamoyltransferase n=1 Tax=Candidatus Kaiserbacteria bacterium RIFCSPLOWO2_01_FULL_54_20 TaxID=1798513 RepID=A0A1F6EJ98_9BACT|nr:MAG: tRNA (adenosine(37)-N6)-threonylcarbamoyltransferase complex transferase subunit TsaD [Candidatus Kaiserbacteria bacterium RIFCSPLOWO2_01_FULL_54_20]